MRFDTSVGTPTLQSRDIRCQSLPKVCVRQDVFCADLSWLLQAPPQLPNRSSHDTGSAQMAPSQRKTLKCKTVALSDIFLLDPAPRIYGLGFDLKTEKSPSERLARDLKAMTTINHSIYIVNVDAARVDESVYVECKLHGRAVGGLLCIRACSVEMAFCWRRVRRRYVEGFCSCVDFPLLTILKGLLLLRKSASDSIARQKL